MEAELRGETGRFRPTSQEKNNDKRNDKKTRPAGRVFFVSLTVFRVPRADLTADSVFYLRALWFILFRMRSLRLFPFSWANDVWLTIPAGFSTGLWCCLCGCLRSVSLGVLRFPLAFGLSLRRPPLYEFFYWHLCNDDGGECQRASEDLAGREYLSQDDKAPDGRKDGFQ